MSHHDTFHDDGPPIAQLQAAVKSLDSYVRAALPPHPPISLTDQSRTPSPRAFGSIPGEHNSASVTPVQQFGRQDSVARRWKDIGKSHLAVCGLGGMGAIVADALVRAGVGSVLLVDHEQIRWSCVGRAAFYPEEVGFSRAQALRLRLQSIHMNTVPKNGAASVLNVDSFSVDWSNDDDLSELRKKLKVSCVGASMGSLLRSQSADEDSENENDKFTDHRSGLGLFEALTQRRPYDAVVSCLEDESDRQALNQICLELSLPLFYAVLSPCGKTVSISSVLPGYTCCCECIIEGSTGSTKAAEATQAQSNAMDQVAGSIAKAIPALLPHVEVLAGGLLGQHTLKFLLDIGDFVPFFTVNTQTFEMESYSFTPSRSCSNKACKQRQDEEQSTFAERS